MNYQTITNNIVEWLNNYIEKNNVSGFVIGISGGIDSAVVSTLCAHTNKLTMCVSMPIHQQQEQVDRAIMHMLWLESQFNCVKTYTVDLTSLLDTLEKKIPSCAVTTLSIVNARARLRMTTLYTFASANNCLVVGTGNKIEDYGVGFFTKYGDGGVDLSPIGDLTKTEVYEIARQLHISNEIIKAKPTDGLWADNRGDEDQLGATYSELEWAMSFIENYPSIESIVNLTDRKKIILDIYLKRHNQNIHKMQMPLICKIK